MLRPARAIALLLLGALCAGPLASLAPAAGSPCRCTDHVCCGTSKSATVCPLRRAGLPCGMPAAPPAGPSLRSGCSCGHGGPPGTVAREEPALAPRAMTLPAERISSAARPRSERARRAFVSVPESPPPRGTRALV
jgi:hypothetical protein